MKDLGGSSEKTRRASENTECGSYRVHPLSVLDYITPYFFVFLLPFARFSLNSLLDIRLPVALISEIVFCLVIIVFSTIKWKNTSLKYKNNSLEIAEGLFFRKKTEIQLERITVIEVITDLRGRMFGCALVRINTEAGSKGKADFQIRLRSRDAAALLCDVGMRENGKTVRFSPFRVVLTAASISSALGGLLLVSPAIKRIGDLLGVAMEQVLIDRINTLNTAVSLFPPAVNAAVIILTVLYGIAFLISFCKLANLRVTPSSTIKVERGLIIRKQIFISSANISSVITEQTPIMRLLKRYILKINVAGYAGKRAESAVLVPCATRRETEGILDGEEEGEASVRLKPHPSQRRRFYLKPTVLLLASLAVSATSAALFEQLGQLIAFCELAIVLIILYYFSLARYDAVSSALIIGDKISAKHSRGSVVRAVCCDARRIGVIDISRWPRDRWEGTCRIRLLQCAKNDDYIKLKHLPYTETKSAVSRLCGHNIKEK